MTKINQTSMKGSLPNQSRFCGNLSGPWSMVMDKARHDKMVSPVERRLKLHTLSPRTPQEKERVALILGK